MNAPRKAMAVNPANIKAAAKAGAAKAQAARAQMAKPMLMPIDTQLQRCLWAAMITAAFCVAMCMFVYSNKRQDVLLANTVDSKVYAPPYSDQPQMSSEAIAYWSVQAVAAIYNYDMNNIDQRLLAARYYFTKNGWESFLGALRETKLVDKVKSEKQVVTSVVASPPIIVWEQDKNGVHTWFVVVAIRSSVDTGRSKPTSSNIMVRLTVEQIPTKLSFDGYALGIAKMQ